MSNSFLPFLQTQITRYGMIFNVVLGGIGCICLTLIFLKNRNSPCANYLICAAIMNFVYLIFNGSITLYTLNNGDPALRSLSFCKIRYYFANVVGQMARYMIVFACIDRFLVSNSRASLRALSRLSIARRVIMIMSIILILYNIHVAIFTMIKNGLCHQFDSYYFVYNYHLVIMNNVIPPVTMSIIGLLIYRNLKGIHMRIRPIRNKNINEQSNIILRRQDRELMKMLLMEICVYVCSSILFPCIILEITITSSMTKTIEHTEMENLIQAIAIFLIYINNAASFYIYLTASKAFRRDFKNNIDNFWRVMTNKRAKVTVLQQSKDQPK